MCMAGSTPIDWDRERAAMVDAIEAEARAYGATRLSAGALAALRAVPRHAFVPAVERRHSYVNEPLPIGLGQTISQPFMVAWLVDEVGASPGRRILEIGTGCGYQAAVLAAAGADVWSVEIRPQLARRARRLLDALGFGRVHTRVGDGGLGWPEAAPFDGIVLTAAPIQVPPPLFEQLAPGGVLVAPVGQTHAVQRLVRYARGRGGAWEGSDLGGVRFVPLVDAEGRPR
jgi:protein-L-isoaspartate(D-aspartate) O-methyltransferase